ncbi:MAG: ATP-binding protein [Bacteroidota bacterium]|nr:ATP-binding protein [Bacteroidota bacterium]
MKPEHPMRCKRLQRGRCARIVLFAYFGGGLCLFGLWGLWEYTRWLRWDEAEARARQKVQEAIQNAWRGFEAELQGRATQLVRHPIVRQGLEGQTWTLVSWLEQLRWEEELWSVDVLDPDGRELAWRGQRMPLAAEGSAQGPQGELIVEPGRRVYLVALHPVRTQDRLLGFVRIGRLLRSWLPVQNAYIREYDWVRPWRERWGRGIEIHWLGSVGEPQANMAEGAPLRLSDGRMVGLVRVGRLERPLAFLPWFAQASRGLWALWLILGCVLLALRWGPPLNGPRPELALLVWSLFWWAFRWALQAVPWTGEWFRPVWLGSGALGSLSRSLGDLLLTGLFAFGWALGLWRWARWPPAFLPTNTLWGPAYAFCGLFLGLIWAGLGRLLEQLAVDSTLTYLALQGLLPDLPVMGLYAALCLLGTAMLLVGLWPLGQLERRSPPLSPLAAATALLGGLLVAGVARPAAWDLHLAFSFGATLAYTLWRLRSQGAGGPLLPYGIALRFLLLAPTVLVLLLYPLWLRAVRAQWRVQMQELAQRLVRQEDRWVMFTLEQALRQLQGEPELAEALRRSGGSVDSLLADMGLWALLRALRGYQIELRVYDLLGRGRNHPPEAIVLGPALPERLPADWIASYYRQVRRAGPWVYVVPGRSGRQERYEGVAPVLTPDRRFFVGWIVVRAVPTGLSTLIDMPLPRVLVRSEMYADWQARFAVAVFERGQLLRSRGGAFARHRLDLPALTQDQWRLEREGERTYWTLYRPAGQERVVAVRAEAPAGLLHLFFAFQLWPPAFAAALCLLLALSFALPRGVLWRYRRFRDKLFDAVLLLSLLVFIAVGGMAYRVIRQQNLEQLRQQVRGDLETVQAYLGRAGAWETARFRVASAQLDSLAQLLDVDINLYREARLEATSRPAVFQYHLLDDRLPLAVYRQLYGEGLLEVFSRTQIGRFTFWTGYRLLQQPPSTFRGVLAVPTLPQQQRVELQLATTMAYLIGAYAGVLLVMVLLVALLADAVAAPLRRLRAGLERVAQGRLDEPIPVRTEDELGELARSYNAMLAELDRSQKALTRQAQELAWREMARQVAHEIRNPLTPMKLSLQYLERSYREGREDFGDLFARTVRVLLEQIETLSRIASEFSHFARMSPAPPEPLDVREVLQEAAALFEQHPGIRINCLFPDQPHVVRAGREDLRRVFVNLLQNAIQAMPKGGEVHLELRAQNGYVRVAVSDTGPGIPPEIRDKLFLPNFSTKSSGMGLGLAIVRKTVEDLGGRVYFETELGRGTTFFVELPLQAGVSASASSSESETTGGT